MRKSERQRAKARAWEAFSIYIRTRDAVTWQHSTTHGRCITCSNLIPVKGSDAGHYVPGRSDNLLFEEHNCHLQCPGCNRFKQGMFIEYEKALVEMYGEEEVTRLKQLKFQYKKYTIDEYKEIREKYKEKLKTLLEDFND